VKFNGVVASVSSWSDTSVTVTVPATATTGLVTLTEQGVESNGVQFTVNSQFSITGISPASGAIGTSVTFSGVGFGATQSTSTANFYGAVATNITGWSDTEIVAVVPAGTATGLVSVKVAGITAQGPTFTVTATTQLTDSLSHSSTYTTAMIGGQWYVSDAQGSGCSSCTSRGVIHHTFDVKGNILSATDELGRTTSYTYDSNGNVLTVSQPTVGSQTPTTTYTYNSFGQVLTVTDPLGHVTTNTYDEKGNLTSVTTPAPDGSTPASVTQFTYDSLGQLTQITDPLNRVTTIAYNSVGLISTITDAQNNVTSYGYDARGNRTSVTDALNKTTTFTYDTGDKLTQITGPSPDGIAPGPVTTFGYDYRGRRTSVTDANNKTTTYAYDDADRLTSVTDAARQATTYAYDTENNLTGITDANLRTTYFTYDAFGRVTQTNFPSTLSETYAYDAVGNLTSKTDRKNQTINYVYDTLDRLSHRGYPDGSGVDYVYDLVGKIQQVNDPTGTYVFAYDNMGRLIGTTTSYSFLTSRTFTTSYTYDKNSNRTGFTDPEGGSTTYAYDTLNRLTTLTPPTAFTTGSFGFSYDALSRRTQMTRPNGVNTDYTYDNLSRLLSVLHKLGGNTIDGATYTVDAIGNRTVKTNHLPGAPTEAYTYDAIYQLTQVTQAGPTTTESYTYDPVGNRLSSLAAATWSYNASNHLTSISGSPGTTFTYDNNGNTLTKTDSSGTTTFAWDYENRLASVTLPSTAVVSFRYDPLGRRIQKATSSATTIYAYEGDNIVQETDASGTAQARFTMGFSIDEPLAQLRSGATHFYSADGLGSITSLTNGAGAIAATYSYDTFGNLTSYSGLIVNPFRYTGREWDSEIGIYYYRARFHDASMGRFINEDSIRFRAGINFFTYVENDPINLTDPKGMQAGMVQAQVAARLASGQMSNPCPDCIQRYLRDLERALGYPGCVVGCTIIWGPLDDIVWSSGGLLFKKVRTWILSATGKTIIKAVGWCGLVGATVYCTAKCEPVPKPEPSKYLLPGLTPFRIFRWANRN
jgi:RHS repeat-associated protein